MIDSIYTAMSGLQGYEKGLKQISGNVANMNTPGYRGSHTDFSDHLSGDPTQDEANGGRGLDASRVLLDLRAGDLQKTDRGLDLAAGGDGFFVVRNEAGELRYTRDGSFDVDAEGRLVMRGTGLQVQGQGGDGGPRPITLDGLRGNPPVATREVLLSGNLSSTDTEHAIDNVAVYDRTGGSHTLGLKFTADSATPGSWVLTVLEGTVSLGTGRFAFTGRKPSTDTVNLTLTLSQSEPLAVAFKLDADTTSDSTGTTSTLALKQQNGRAAGQIQTLGFDTHGVLKVAYTNGQTRDGATLLLAEVQDSRRLRAEGDNLYRHLGDDPPAMSGPSDLLTLTPKSLEKSNVDLTDEFSTLILLQRGYQASSEVLTTANEMLQQLFEIRGQR